MTRANPNPVTKDRDKLADSIFDLVSCEYLALLEAPTDPKTTIVDALSLVLASYLAGSEELSASDIDFFGTKIGQEIAGRAHQFRRLRDEGSVP
jgi:hypothetical protein